MAVTKGMARMGKTIDTVDFGKTEMGVGDLGGRELGDYAMHTCHHTMLEPAHVISTSIKAVKPPACNTEANLKILAMLL